MAVKRMGKKEVVSIIEQELRRQAATGTVSSRLIENYISVRGWRKKKGKAARAEAPPRVDEAPLVDLIAAAKEASGPAEVPQEPATGPVQPQRPQALSHCRLHKGDKLHSGP